MNDDMVIWNHEWDIQRFVKSNHAERFEIGFSEWKGKQ